MMRNNYKLDLVTINVNKIWWNSIKLFYIKFGEILSICSQDIVWKQILTKIKGHNSGANVGKMMCNNPKLDLVNMNVYIKFGKIL